MDTYKNASKTLSQAEQQKLDKDLAARLEALDITRSFIVQAPAGSGKTGLLTQRFLKLLANVENPEDILAITFTNKAVGEMQERIMQALRQASVAEEEPANKYEAQVWNLAKEVIQRDREKRWELLANPARLRIRTIDSFCSYLAKNLPVSSNFGCLLDTDGQSEKLYSQAAAQAVNFLLTYAVQPAEEFSPWQTESEPSGTKIDVRCRKLAEELQYVLCTAFDNNQSELEKSLAEALKNRGPIIRLLQQEAEAEGLEYSCRDYSAFEEFVYNSNFEHLREQMEKSYHEWCEKICSDLDAQARAIDPDFLNIVCDGASALVSFNGGPQAFQVNPRLSAWAELANLKTQAEPQRVWYLASKILLTASGATLRREFTNRGLSGGLKIFPDKKTCEKEPSLISFVKLKEFWEESGLGRDVGYAGFESNLNIAANCFQNCLDGAEVYDVEPGETKGAEGVVGDSFDYGQVTVWEDTVKKLHIFQFAWSCLRSVFAQTLSCDYEEISQAALTASDPFGLSGLDKFSIDNPIKHILVDEYQDTSWSQYKLINNLTCNWSRGDGCTIFCVGDPMQSIYRFRGADVSVYMFTRDHGFGHGMGDMYTFDDFSAPDGSDPHHPKFLQLHQNFRSNCNLVYILGQDIFPNVFPKNNEERIDQGKVAFSSSFAAIKKESAVPIVVEPILHVESLQKLAGDCKLDFDPTKYDAGLYESELIVREIIRKRKSEPGAVCAVLLETKDLGMHLLEELQRRGLPIVQKDIYRLSESAPVPLLLSITAAFLEPLEPLNWIHILSSPLFGLSWEEICLIGERYLVENTAKAYNSEHLYSRPREFWKSIVGFAKLRYDQARAGDERTKHVVQCCRRLYGAFKRAFSLRRGLPLVRCIEGIWQVLGGPVSISQSQGETAEQYFSFLSKYDTALTWPTVSDIKDDLENLSAKKAPEGDNPVQFFTIHGAKGLEFDYVFLPGLGSKGGCNDGWQFLEYVDLIDEKLGSTSGSCLLAPGKGNNAAWEPLRNSIRAVHEQFEDNELVRLFYVGATRPKATLYLYPHIRIKTDSKNNTEITPTNGSKILSRELFECLLDKKFLREEFGGLIGATKDVKSFASAYLKRYSSTMAGVGTEEDNQEQIERLVWNWPTKCNAAHLWDEDGKLYSWFRERDNGTEKRELSVNRDDYVNYRVHLGNIVHGLLESLSLYLERGNELVADPCELWPIFEPKVRALCSQDLDSEKSEKAYEEAKKAFFNVLSDKVGRLIVAPHRWAHCEQPFYVVGRVLAEEAGEIDVKKKVMDRIFVHNDVLWIVDYKTSVPREGESFDNFYARKLEDYRPQLEGYEKIAAHCNPRNYPIRSFLYFPLVVGPSVHYPIS